MTKKELQNKEGENGGIKPKELFDTMPQLRLSPQHTVRQSLPWDAHAEIEQAVLQQ